MDTADPALDKVQKRLAEAHARCRHFSGDATREELTSALTMYEEVRALGSALDDTHRKSIEATVRGSFGNVLSKLGQHEQAVEHYTVAMSLSRQIGDAKGAAQKQGNLGNAYRHLGQLTLAADHLERAVATSNELGDSGAEKNGLYNLSCAYLALGQHNKCLAVLLRLAALDSASTHRLEELYRGRAVSLRELRAKPELNGQLGKIDSFVVEKGRVGVSIDGTTLSVKPANLDLEAPATDGTATSDQHHAPDAAIEWAEALRTRGVDCMQRSELDAALLLFEACRTEARRASNHMEAQQMQGYALASICQARGFLQQWEQATEAANLSLGVFEAIADTRGMQVARDLLQMLGWHPSSDGPTGARQGHAHRLEVAAQHADRGEKEQAEAIYREEARSSEDASVRKAALGSLASILHGRRDFAGAVEILSEVVAICQSIGHVKSESLAHLKLAEAFYGLGKLQDAIWHYEKALELSQNNGRPGMAGIVLCSMGQAQREMGRYDDAVKQFRKALEISHSIDDKELRMKAHSGLGQALAYLSHLAEAKEHHESALTLSRSLGHAEMETVCLSNLGGVYISMNRPEDARRLLGQCVVLSRSRSDFRTLSSALTMLGKCTDDLTKAIQQHRLALTAAQQVQDQRLEANASSDLVNALTQSGQFQEALDELKRSPDIPGAAEGLKLWMRGNLQGNLTRFDEALESLNQALNINRSTGDMQQEAICLCNIGSIHMMRGCETDAISALEASATLFDRIWQGLTTDFDRIRYGDSLAPTASQKLQWVHFEAGRAEEALVWAERSRARSLEVLLARQRDSKDATPPSMLPSSPPMPAGDFQSLARRQQVAILVYSLLDRCGFADGPRLLIWAITAGSLVCRVATKDVRVPELVEEARIASGVTARQLDRDIVFSDDSTPETGQTLATRENAPLANALRRCYQLLIEPVESELSSASCVLIIPDAELYHLPFAALTSSNGGYLIEKHALRVAPALRTLLELEQRMSTGSSTSLTPSALVVGDPLLDWQFHKRLQPLPGALAESELVKELLERRCGERVTCLRREQATKAAVLAAMREVAYIHMATHGSPEALMLAGAEEGMLSMAEVQQLSLLPSSLVVLSACQTFHGTLSSDGVVGIARAFLAAGASSLVASLWPVEDVATRTLMERFYEGLLSEPGRDAAAALQDAMTSMLREEGRFSVKQWAPFVVYGL